MGHQQGVYLNWVWVALNLFVVVGFKDFIYLSLERGEGRERNINVWLPLTWPLQGTWPATQACALTRNWTGDPLVRRPALSPLSHTSQGWTCFTYGTAPPPFSPNNFIVIHIIYNRHRWTSSNKSINGILPTPRQTSVPALVHIARNHKAPKRTLGGAVVRDKTLPAVAEWLRGFLMMESYPWGRGKDIFVFYLGLSAWSWYKISEVDWVGVSQGKWVLLGGIPVNWNFIRKENLSIIRVFKFILT